ncbi:MAG TPA: FtsX-like permease family protein [Anaeromyxobacteraceae bacterium]|nr:FtsX-like permease family protein [Anaeromyxobacteraceae bacterium]
MNLIDFKIAARSLFRHTKRNLLLGGAIAAVTLLLVLMGGLTEGIRSAMLESASTLMTGHVNVGGFFKFTSGASAPLVNDYEQVLEVTRRIVPEIDYVTVRGRGWAKAVSEQSSMDLVLGGIDVAHEPGFRKNVRIVSGNLDALAKPNTILLFEDQAKRLEVQVGDALTLSAPTARGVNNTADVRVVAVAKNLGILSAFNAFISGETLRGLYQLRRTATGALHLYLQDPSSAREVAARLRSRLAEAGFRVMDADPKPYWEKLMGKVNSEDWVGQKLDVTTWEDELTFISWILSAVGAITGVLMFILLVIVVIGILNTLAIAIRERTREIGTLRAIGMQRTRVLFLFVLEATLLGAVGATTGALAGVALSALVNAIQVAVPDSVQMFLMQQHLTLTVLGKTVLARALLILVLTGAAALVPALHAARLKPITAMHHVG